MPRTSPEDAALMLDVSRKLESAKAAAVLAQIANNPHLPTPPAVALKALQLANRPSCTMHELGKLIGCDPGLSGRLLRLVNSPMFGVPRSITSIEQALRLLGLNRLRSLVLGFSLPALRFQTAASEHVKACWKESVARAVIARELAARLGWADPNTEMIAALLCDLGVLLLQEMFADAYRPILAQPPELLLRNQCRLESAALGVDHAQVSAYILHGWGMPEEVTEAIRQHHEPPRLPAGGPASRAQLLYFATHLARLQSQHARSRASLLEEISVLALEQFRMDSMQFAGFLEGLHTRIGEIADLVEIDVGSYENWRVIYQNAVENLTNLTVEMSLDLLQAEDQKQQVEAGLKRAEEALQAKDAQLARAQKLDAIGRLAGGVAHDFNNLLTVIIGYCELLQLGPLPEAVGQPIEQIKKAGDKAALLTRQLLALSRKQTPAPQILDVNSALGNVVEMLRRTLGQDIEIATRLCPTVPAIEIDPGQFDQVIINLALNARDAMPNGGRLTLETHAVPSTASEAATQVLLIVRDTGSGMDTHTLARLFEPFFTTKPLGRGTGLGLATVEAIVKQAGGTIEVASALAQGTTFQIRWPAAPVAAPAPCAPRPDELLRGTETILVADNDEDVRIIARRTLERHGYTVLEASTGPAALALAAACAGPIDVLLTDVLLPQLSGADLAIALTQQRPNLKTLVLSGFGDDPPFATALPTGARFLYKPFTPRHLAAKLREVLAGGRA